MIAGRLHGREGKALTNFRRTLPPEGSDMAEQILRDPYNFDFLQPAVRQDRAPQSEVSEESLDDIGY